MTTARYMVLGGALAALLASASATASFAQAGADTSQAPSADRGQMMEGMDHGQMMDHVQEDGTDQGQDVSQADPASTATEAYRAASAAMHAAMDIELTGDADVDFARGMIAHHEGAIDMATVLLEHGDDRELRELAEAIIAAQEAEVAFLEAWLAEHAE